MLLLVKAEGTWRRRIAPPVTPWANPYSQGGTTRSDRRFRCLVAEQTQRLLRLRDWVSPGGPPRGFEIFILETSPGRFVLIGLRSASFGIVSQHPRAIFDHLHLLCWILIGLGRTKWGGGGSSDERCSGDERWRDMGFFPHWAAGKTFFGDKKRLPGPSGRFWPLWVEWGCLTVLACGKA